MYNDKITSGISVVMPEFLPLFSGDATTLNDLTSEAFTYAQPKMYSAIFKMRKFLEDIGPAPSEDFSDILLKMAVISEILSDKLGHDSVVFGSMHKEVSTLFEKSFPVLDINAVSGAADFIRLCKRSLTLTDSGSFCTAVLDGANLIHDPPEITVICKRPLAGSVIDGAHELWRSGRALTLASEYGLRKATFRSFRGNTFGVVRGHIMIPGKTYLTSLPVDCGGAGDDYDDLRSRVEAVVYSEVRRRFRRSSKGNLFHKSTDNSDEILISGMLYPSSFGNGTSPFMKPINEGGAAFDVLALTPFNYDRTVPLSLIARNLTAACVGISDYVPVTVVPRIEDERLVNSDASLLRAVENHASILPCSFAGGAVLKIFLDPHRYFPDRITLHRAVSAFFAGGGVMITFISGDPYDK